MCPDISLSAEDTVIWCSRLVCYLEDPYGDIRTPNILDACLGDILYISYPTSCNGSVSVASLYASRHFPSGSYLKSIRYHFFFYALTFPLVALAAPAQILRPFCASFTVYSRGVSGEGATSMIVESSMKKYPTRWKESCDMLHLKTAPCPTSMTQFRRGELAMAHISGASPFH